MPEVTPAAVSSDDPQTYEDTHVHAVYDEIAPHFSFTRYKPWPIIAAFMSSLPTGWVGVDLGTGNGKYLPLPSDRPNGVWTVGFDRSLNLLKIAKRAGDGEREVVWGDVLDHPWRTGAFDYAISIATIHHLATPYRRKVAVQRLLQSISPAHGRALIYVWAIEQDQLSKRAIPTDSTERGQTFAPKGQDVYVPWVLNPSTATKPKTKQKKRSLKDDAFEDGQLNFAAFDDPPKVFNRYYHMFSQGELRDLVVDAAQEMQLVIGEAPDAPSGSKAGPQRGVHIVADGWERSNYYVELRRWQQ
ncbi:S-adenosyl-L-methionine-dependent methyltransferase [Epithele typhae]|uniref:S-adenosyl-L-methionine-dependent methyltransferase n=1 Tax=Epithele typhae TaxID=378194 RepID=UPI0020087942|nr:S-adenosyl-L-methionine-dependent methyltransferase [Epithele typhae]KAH9946058.1 S-adenosyl-L-methionine-dependent methyltransferase [Epithele typhae]